MAIPSSINIPNLYVQSPLSSALKGGLTGYIQAKQLDQQQKQQQMQQQQMAQQQAMVPLQQQLMQAQIGKMQEEAQGIPMKAHMDMMLKQRAQDNKIIELGTNNPTLMSDPNFSQQFQTAKSRISQDIQPGIGLGVQPGQYGQQGLQQQLQHPDAPNMAEQMQFREEQKLIPADLKNQMVRSGSASLMIHDLRNDIKQLEPFFGVSGSLKGAIRSYAASKGLSDDEEARLYNTLNKKIMATAGEVAAGMTKSRAESTIKEWQDIVNPITGRGVGYKQVLDNLNTLEDIHNINSDALFENYPISRKHHNDWMSSRKDHLSKKYVPRGTPAAQPVDQQTQYSQSEIMAELKRRGLG